MELLVGVERADEVHKKRRTLHVEAVLSSVPIVDYTLEVADLTELVGLNAELVHMN
jgi:hypothetical protein